MELSLLRKMRDTFTWQKSALHPLEISAEHIQSLEQFNTKSASHFHSLEGKSFVQTPLGELYNALLRPFRNQKSFSLTLEKIQIKEVDASTFEHTARVVNWAYNKRYKVSDGSYIPLALEYHPTSSVKMYAATVHVGGEEVVLSTFTIAQDQGLEIFQLFEVHESIQQNAVELKRFARHPIFDLLKLSSDEKLVELSIEYPKHIVRKMWQHMGTYLQAQNRTPYYILAPHVKKWLDSAGIGPVRQISHAPKVHDPQYQELLRLFPYYWQKNPGVYQAPLFPKTP